MPRRVVYVPKAKLTLWDEFVDTCSIDSRISASSEIVKFVERRLKALKKQGGQGNE